MSENLGLSNREIATAIWVAIFLVWTLSKKDTRRAVKRFLRVLLGRTLLLSLMLIATYIYAETRILSLVGLWDQSHLKDTIIWALTSAFVIFVNLSNIQSDQHFFKKTALSSFNVSVAMSFFVNLYSFHFVIEIIFVPLVTLLVALQVFVNLKEDLELLRSPINNVLAVIGLVVISYIAYAIYSDFYTIFSLKLIKDFAVPPLLSILFLPLIYFFFLLLRYEGVFARLNYCVPNEGLRKYLKYQLVWTYGVNVWRLNRWASVLPSFKFQSKDDVLNSLREREQVIAEPPLGYRGFTWGASPNNGLKQLHEPTEEGVTIYSLNSSAIPLLFGLSAKEEAYSFVHDKFYAASIWFDGFEAYEKLRVILSGKYGPPSFVNDRFPLIKWKWPASQIEIRLYFEKQHSIAALTYSSDAI